MVPALRRTSGAYRRRAGPLGVVIHTATQAEKCADGLRVAAPSAVSPQMRADAAEVSAEFDGRWAVYVDLGVLHARRVGTPPGHTPVTVDASTKDELRTRLRVQESIDKLRTADQVRRGGPEGAR